MNATCTLHPDRLATAACAECNRPTCPECAQSVVAGKPVCAQCVAAIRTRVAAQLNTQPGAPSAIPINTPASRSAVPMNAPRASGPGAGAPQPGQAPYQPSQAAQPPQPLYQPPTVQSSSPTMPQPSVAPPDLSAGYSPRPAAAAPLDLSAGYAGAAAQPAPTSYGAQGAPSQSAPTSYGQPAPTPYGVPQGQPQPGYGPPLQAPYGAPPQAPYGAPPGSGAPVPGPSAYGTRPQPAQAASSASPNIALGVTIGIVVFLLVGVAEGMLAVNMHTYFPYLSIINGLIVGHAVKAACGVGHGPGIVAAACSFLSCATAYAIMYAAMGRIDPVGLLLLFYATARGYRIAGYGAKY